MSPADEPTDNAAAPRAEAHPALDVAIAELERAAERLRSGDLAPDQAAQLVEECAELAARVGGELDRAVRDAAAEAPASGQETLL